MSNHDDIWKAMRTPRELPIFTGDSFEKIKQSFDYILSQGECVRCPMSGTVHNMPYRRTISPSMARGLQHLYDAQVKGLKIDGTPNHFADFTKLRHWNLIYKMNEGGWRISKVGIDFVEGRNAMQRHAVVVNNKVVKYMGYPVSFKGALNK